MSHSGINFKVYCVSGENSEVKRFSVDSDAVTSFIFMKEKLKSVFTNLKDCDFKITWKDSDGDHISITSDDDFITALTEMNDNPKVLYVNCETKNSNDEDAPHQFRVVCDVCQNGITKYRYKCIECADYDLCATCEGNGHHSEHIMLRLPSSSTPFARLDRKMMYNAARALKKSACGIAKEAHRHARDSFKSCDRERHGHRHHGGHSNVDNNTSSCPFAPSDFEEMKGAFADLLSKGASALNGNPESSSPFLISDIVRSVAEAFNGIVNVEPGPSSASTQTTDASAQSSRKDSAAEQNTTNNQNTQPSAPPANNETNTQDMDWTIVNESRESSTGPKSGSQTPQVQPPPPPQDPRLMKGLAQLYEMGFSNENQFLNYMLETHDYNVNSVVKAILEMK